MRVEEDVNYDRLTLEVWTNKGITPPDAISLASKFLMQHFAVTSELMHKFTNKIICMNVKKSIK